MFFMELIFEVAHDEDPLENNSILRELIPLGIAPLFPSINGAVIENFFKAYTWICVLLSSDDAVSLF